MPGFVVCVDFDAAFPVAAQAEFQNALVDAAKLLHRQVTIADVFGSAPVVSLVAEAENRGGDHGVRKLHAIENWRGCGLEQAAVVRRYAERIVALRDDTENRSEPRPICDKARRELTPGRFSVGNFEANFPQTEVCVRPVFLRQKTTVFGIENEEEPLKKDQRRFPHVREVGVRQHPFALRVRRGDGVGKTGKHSIEDDF